MLCRWCEQPIEKILVPLHKVIADKFDTPNSIYVWVHPSTARYAGKYRVSCDGTEAAWNRNWGTQSFGTYGPSVATPNFDFEPHPREIRAVERGLRNLLRGLQ